MTSPDATPGEESSRTSAKGARDRRSPGPVDLDEIWHMSIELVAAILVWGGIGWLLDRLLGGHGWLTWSGLMVGTGAGLYLLRLRRLRDEGSWLASAGEEDGTPPPGEATPVEEHDDEGAV